MPLHTDNGEELIGAAVREEAAHGVPTWERGQTLLALLMGLGAEGRKESDLRWAVTLISLSTVQDCVKELVSDYRRVGHMCENC